MGLRGPHRPPVCKGVPRPLPRRRGGPAPGGTGTRLLLRVMLSSSLCMFSRSAVSAFCVFKASSHLASLCSSWTRQERERGGERSQDLAPLTGPPRRPGPAPRRRASAGDPPIFTALHQPTDGAAELSAAEAARFQAHSTLNKPCPTTQGQVTPDLAPGVSPHTFSGYLLPPTRHLAHSEHSWWPLPSHGGDRDR